MRFTEKIKQVKWPLKWLHLIKGHWMKFDHVPKDSDIVIADSRFVIPQKGVKNTFKFFERNKEFSYDAKFVRNNPWDQIFINGCRFNIYTAQSVQILDEVFINRIYEISLPGKPVVIDVGMNVGISSIFLASSLGCPVYGYEPFKDTYEKALLNFKLNPHISSQIHAFQRGVGSTERKENFLFCANSAGDCGIVPISERERNPGKVQRETVEIIPIQTIMDQILKTEPDRDIILKLDCEGMEYEILDSLIKTGGISDIKAILMEWHSFGNLGDPARLQSALKDKGFIIFGTAARKAPVGMLYAVKK